MNELRLLFLLRANLEMMSSRRTVFHDADGAAAVEERNATAESRDRLERQSPSGFVWQRRIRDEVLRPQGGPFFLRVDLHGRAEARFAGDNASITQPDIAFTQARPANLESFRPVEDALQPFGAQNQDALARPRCRAELQSLDHYGLREAANKRQRAS